ncbi:unnamed protein product, partial [marine sediment metagenome]
LMLMLLSCNVLADTLEEFTCDTSTAGLSITLVTFMFVILLVWAYSLYTKIPVLNMIVGLVTCYFAWNVAACFIFANVIFIVMGLTSILAGIFFIGENKSPL